MAKKKVRKKVSRKKPVKRKVSRGKRSVKKKIVGHSTKIKRVWMNLILFLILGVVSFVLFGVSNDEIFVNLFTILVILFGFVTLALFITLLVLYLKKNLPGISKKF